MDRAPRFFADAMLGTLARWLRILGFDTLYESDIDDADLVERAAAQSRIILTRDRRLVLRRRARNHLLVDSDRIEDQLCQVVDELGIGRAATGVFGRCPDCNAALESLPAEAARPEVPPYVAATQTLFRKCPGCARIYWRATHVEAMERRLRALGFALDRVSGSPEAD